MASTINASTSSGLVNTADTSGVLQLQTASTAAVTIDASQNVGIGTASPASKLDIKAGSGSIIARSTSGIGLKSFYDDGRTTYTAVNYDGLSTSGAQDLFISAGTGASQNMLFRTADTERMRITSTGSVTINSGTLGFAAANGVTAPTGNGKG